MFKFLAKLKSLIFYPADPSCSGIKIPSYLHTGKRKKDDSFSPDELIYRRFTAEADVEKWKTNNTLSAAVFPINNDSVNRGKYSRYPEDVLFNTRQEDNGNHYTTHGILSFKVDALQKLLLEPTVPIMLNGEPRNFKFHLEHTPESCMYPHTEIWIMEAGSRVDDKPPKSIRTIARVLLAGICTIVKHPTH